MSRYLDLAATIREQILSGDLEPGQRLPSEPELSELHGVSRSTVREALRVLSSQNLVATTRGVTGGTFVALPERGAISDFLETNLGMLATHEAVDVEALLEVRDLLEVPAAGLAALRADPEALQQLRATIVDPSATDLATIQDCNHRFHALVVRAAENPLLDVVATPVFGVLVSKGVREPVVDARYWKKVLDDHALILTAIESRDAAAAEAAMRAHLDRLRLTYTDRVV